STVMPPRTLPPEQSFGCYLKISLTAKPFVRYFLSRIEIAKVALESIDPAIAAAARVAAGAPPTSVEEIAKQKEELERRLNEANKKIKDREIKDTMKLLWEVGVFVSGNKKGLSGPLLLADLLLDHSNQSESPLDLAYARGLINPQTHDLYAADRESLLSMLKAFQKARDSVAKLPPYDTNVDSLATLDKLIEQIQTVLSLLDQGADPEKAKDMEITDKILNSKPMDIDPGMIDTFNENEGKWNNTV
ncbi:hypothetical protein ACCS96_00640, partial [Rhizobium ruizarguesonis]